MPEHEPHPFPGSDVISCLFPCKQFWQSGRYHWHSLFTLKQQLHMFTTAFPSGLLMSVFHSTLWLSLTIWENCPRHHYLALLVTPWLLCSEVVASGLKAKKSGDAQLSKACATRSVSNLKGNRPWTMKTWETVPVGVLKPIEFSFLFFFVNKICRQSLAILLWNLVS